MAAPNIVGVTTIYGNTALVALTSTSANLVTNSTGSSSVIKLNDITVSNYSNASITTNVIITRSATNYYLAGNITVPAYSSLVVVGKDTAVYQIEGDYIQANSSAATHAIASYETIS